ncbi:MAG: fumarylacetoacetate hydrolase family protein [Rhodocyclaceae bacterium]|nr:fumarylacetoacetate hydrolase family protein [Rhodocyclaceae bacterium]
MKLMRWGAEGHERVGLVDQDGVLRDLSPALGGSTATPLDPEVQTALARLDPASLPALPPETRLGACIDAGGKIVAVGLNYADHVREAGMQVPPAPLLFMKACRVSAPDAPLWLPPGHSKVDWEIELAVVIGREAICVDEADALDHVAGYATFIDFSERAWQLEGPGQWVKGKSFPSFAPIGPWLATGDAIADPNSLHLWLEVNDQRLQDSNTAEMIFRVPRLISDISRHMALYPGDVIATGTPPGVGMGLKPQRWLAAGDHVRAGIEGLGEQQHLCRPWPTTAL